MICWVNCSSCSSTPNGDSNKKIILWNLYQFVPGNWNAALLTLVGVLRFSDWNVTTWTMNVDCFEQGDDYDD